MGFGKAFGLGLLTYMLLNLGLTIVWMAVLPGGIGLTMIGALFTNPVSLIGLLLIPAIIPGSTGLLMIGGIMAIPGTELMILFMALWLILPGVLGALVAGKSGESAGAAFGGWFLAPTICAVIIAVLALMSPGMDVALGMLISMMAALGGVTIAPVSGALMIILAGVTNGLMWSGIAAASAGP